MSYEQLKLSNQLCFPLYAASRKVTRAYATILAPFGLTYTKYIVMLVLWEQDQLGVKELGAYLMLDSGTLTPLLKKLESQGLLTRERRQEDERNVSISLTKAGQELKEKMAHIPFEIGKTLGLTLEEINQLHQLLYKLLGDEYMRRLK
jgi:DNA-binding MarR family transcriptional regulator